MRSSTCGVLGTIGGGQWLFCSLGTIGGGQWLFCSLCWRPRLYFGQLRKPQLSGWHLCSRGDPSGSETGAEPRWEWSGVRMDALQP